MDVKFKREFAIEFRYQEFAEGDYLDEFYEDEDRFERNLHLKANAYLQRSLMLGEILPSEYEELKQAIMTEFGL